MGALDGKKILLVDDEIDLREILKDEFELSGATVLMAENGRKGFEIAQRENPDAIVSDIRMAGGSGVELLENVRKNNTARPVVVLMTGFADLSIEDAYARGANAIFGKPFNVNEIIDAVSRAMMPAADRYIANRKHPRKPSDASVHLKFKDLHQAIDAKVLNIGRGGMFVALSNGFPNLSEEVEFNVQFEAGAYSPLKGSGVCRWIREAALPEFPSGVGIEFTELTEESIKHLDAFVRDLAPLAFIPKK